MRGGGSACYYPTTIGMSLFCGGGLRSGRRGGRGGGGSGAERRRRRETRGYIDKYLCAKDTAAARVNSEYTFWVEEGARGTFVACARKLGEDAGRLKGPSLSAVMLSAVCSCITGRCGAAVPSHHTPRSTNKYGVNSKHFSMLMLMMIQRL